MAKSGRSQGGLIGKINKTSFGKNKVTRTTATGTFTTQPGTTKLTYTIIAGGGGAMADGGGGGGAGGVYTTENSDVCGATGYPVTIGAGGDGRCNPGGTDPATRGSSSVAFCTTVTGGGAGGPTPLGPGGSGGGGQKSPPYAGGTGNSPPLNPVQGYAGGTGANTLGEQGGGGGGAGALGGNACAPNAHGGAGGAGRDLTPFYGCAPQPYYIANVTGKGDTACGVFAGGGGGGAGKPGVPGGSPPGQVAVGGDGGGGGGGGSPPGGPTGGKGGSGVVLTKELNYASGVWPQKAQYNKRVTNTWP